MPRDQQHNPDPNQNAARIVAGAAGRAAANDKTPADLEAGWREWSSHVQKVDERALTLLRAAFEAGYEVGRRGELLTDSSDES